MSDGARFLARSLTTALRRSFADDSALSLIDPATLERGVGIAITAALAETGLRLEPVDQTTLFQEARLPVPDVISYVRRPPPAPAAS